MGIGLSILTIQDRLYSLTINRSCVRHLFLQDGSQRLQRGGDHTELGDDTCSQKPCSKELTVLVLLKRALTPIPCELGVTNEGGSGGMTHGEAPAAVWCLVLYSRSGKSVTDRSGDRQGVAVLCLCKKKGPDSLSARFPHCSQLLLPLSL